MNRKTKAPEGRPALSRFLRRLWRRHFSERFDPETRSSVEPLEAFCCLCFRHDMDLMGPAEITKFRELDGRLGLPSTCFFLTYQLRSANEEIKRLAATGCEVELHSEARPTWVGAAVYWLWFAEGAYRRGLKKQLRQMRKYGFDPQGHAPHSIHNYLGFQTWIDWNVIEQASIGTGLKYLSDWRIIARSPEGTETFPEPLPPFYRILHGRRIMVLPTSWDDKFFFASYEDRFIRGSASGSLADRSVEEALASFKKQLSRCRESGVPLVVNLHPVHGVRGTLPTFELKERMADEAASLNLPIISLNRLYTRLSG